MKIIKHELINPDITIKLYLTLWQKLGYWVRLKKPPEYYESLKMFEPVLGMVKVYTDDNKCLAIPYLLDLTLVIDGKLFDAEIMKREFINTEEIEYWAIGMCP